MLVVTVLFATHEAYLEHLTGPGHPERPSRLQAIVAGARSGDVVDALQPLEPVAASRHDLERVHPSWYLDRLDALAAAGGGWIDADTRLSARSAQAARLAAGAGLTAVDALREGRGVAAFCAVRPPGHHATPTDSMGFCLISNIAVVAASLADAGERVWILDYDAHHGNGTQAAFIDDPPRAVRQHAPVAALPRDGSVDGARRRRRLRDDDELPAPARDDGGRVPQGLR